jgi:ketosteroid isomerase-like protein
MPQARYRVPDEIKDTAEAFYRALSNRNMRAVEDIWAHEPYAAVAGRSGRLRQGWPQVRSYWEDRFGQFGNAKVTVRLRNSVCRAVGDVAWLSGIEVRTVKEDDHVRQEELRMTCVLERRGTNWQIVLYHASEPAERSAELATAS